MIEQFNDALQGASALAAGGEPWKAIAELQVVDIEAAVLRLTADDMAANNRSEREAAVAHALTKLYEYWARGERVVSIVGFLKVAAVRHARDARRNRPAPDVEWDEPVHDGPPDEAEDDDPVALRTRAVEIARTILPELGMPSVVATMNTFLDRVAAGDDASPRALATFLDLPYSTVTTHLSRGLKRLEDRLRGRDLDAIFGAADDDDFDLEPIMEDDT